MTETILYSRPDYDIATTADRWADPQMVKLIGKNKDVLELGCASGHFGKYLKHQAGCKIWAIEIDRRLADFSAPFYEYIYIRDASDCSVYWGIERKFDVILCSNVLEHLPNPINTLKWLQPLLKEGGYFVIALPNVAHFSVRLKLLFGNFDYDQGILGEEHLRYYTFKMACQMLKKAGLSVDYWSFDSDNGIPKFDGLLRRLKADWFLSWLYSLAPRFFGFQFIFKCSLA